jgi:hypothetical protein
LYTIINLHEPAQDKSKHSDFNRQPLGCRMRRSYISRYMMIHRTVSFVYMLMIADIKGMGQSKRY